MLRKTTITFLSVLMFVLLINCFGPYTSLPRIDKSESLPQSESVKLREIPLAEIQDIFNTSINTVVFDASRQKGNEAKVTFGDSTYIFDKDEDETWRQRGCLTGGILFIAYGTLGNITPQNGGLQHLLQIDKQEGKLRVCDISLKVGLLIEKSVTGGVKNETVFDWVSQKKARAACYDVEKYLPDQPYYVCPAFDMTGIRIYFVPVDSFGNIDSKREGTVLWNCFDLYHPKGAGNIARVKIVK